LATVLSCILTRVLGPIDGGECRAGTDGLLRARAQPVSLVGHYCGGKIRDSTKLKLLYSHEKNNTRRLALSGIAAQILKFTHYFSYCAAHHRHSTDLYLPLPYFSLLLFYNMIES
jgi:hypothetical protein